MSLLDETRYPERLEFFHGQRLFAPDLQAIEVFNREMRWLHNRSLHQPGIGNGFAVSGEKGDRQVAIGPGYAIDVDGREIVLTQVEILPIPPVATEEGGGSVFFDLTVSYPEDEDLEAAETREGICLDRGVVRRQEKPIFCWIRLKKNSQGNLQPKETKLATDIKDGRKIIVARIEVFNCQLNRQVCIAQRRSARPPKQPYITCGEEQPTKWRVELIIEAQMPEDINLPARAIESGRTNLAFSNLFALIAPFKLVAEINTTQAGFLTTPSYSARLDGSRLWFIDLRDSDRKLSRSNGNPWIIDGLINIDSNSTTSKQFTVEVLLLLQYLSNREDGFHQIFRSLTSTPSNAAVAKQELEDWLEELLEDWHIVWMGVEE
ncbi:MAG: hypothetical protein IGS49_19345 [Chlorogloeopsis fritschii C42_A2020_084]|nr:hypothetical protein [Chlorogloeopsis fritschii C42_A2020_084]